MSQQVQLRPRASFASNPLSSGSDILYNDLRTFSALLCNVRSQSERSGSFANWEASKRAKELERHKHTLTHTPFKLYSFYLQATREQARAGSPNVQQASLVKR